MVAPTREEMQRSQMEFLHNRFHCRHNRPLKLENLFGSIGVTRMVEVDVFDIQVRTSDSRSQSERLSSAP